MNTPYRAHVSTRNFDFEATAWEEGMALMHLRQTLEIHARQYVLDDDWPDEMLRDAEVEIIEIGIGRRDGETLCKDGVAT
jgi:hypothetical protein